ncbi:ran-binding protein M homolog isoform X2 [Macadamia integrifolia]|uniref:ran-binding protein M homolog isoform X2 n=1 Tax=Macadamia integrifolia TaxID=60698 RepID=UPI001C4F8968|nr:ran-binding protein M homolog isoform X2 [Macadamia integrifolia]
MISDQDSGGFSLDLSKFSFRRGTDDMDVEEVGELPTRLNTINSSGGFLVVSTDKLSVQYTSVNLHGHDVGVVQANCPAPVKRLVYYFEIFVKNAGAKGQIAIGFTTENFKMRRQPGWEANSYGYHGDDGLLYRGLGKGETFGPTFTSGDTIGGGINYASQEFFFTKNGKLVGTVYKDVKGPLFPTIAVHSQNEEVNVNFGQKPFVFGIEAFALEERMKQQMMIEKTSLPLNISHRLVRSYLQHYGYQDTLNSFDLASKSTLPPIPVAQENGIDEQADAYALSHRKILRQLMNSGDLDSVFGKLRDWYPQILQNKSSTIFFLLHCQKYIELVRDCIALLAYEEPMKSPVAYLLDLCQREVVADALNSMVLSTNPRLKDPESCLQSCLERLLRQLTACCFERRSLNGDQGETFQLHRVLQSEEEGKS